MNFVRKANLWRLNEESVSSSDPIERARAWATDVWQRAVECWNLKPGQNETYRDTIVSPAIKDALRRLELPSPFSFVDVGAGDGASLQAIREVAVSLGLEVRALANEVFKGQTDVIHARVPDVPTLTASVTDPDFSILVESCLGRRPELVTSIFVLQDLPNLTAALEQMHGTLAPGGSMLSVIVHPSFALRLEQRGQLRIPPNMDVPPRMISSNGIVQWEKVRLYPIETEAQPFFVPYFHREIGDYEEALRNAGFSDVTFRDLAPSADLVERAMVAKLPPFSPTSHSVYYPDIVSTASALLIECKS